MDARQARRPAWSPAPGRSAGVRLDPRVLAQASRQKGALPVAPGTTWRIKPERRPEASILCRIERFQCQPATGGRTGISELGRQITVDLEADADFNDNGRGPCHGVAPCDGPLGAEMLRRLCSPICATLSVRQGPISTIAITDSTTTLCYMGAIRHGGEAPNER